VHVKAPAGKFTSEPCRICIYDLADEDFISNTDDLTLHGEKVREIDEIEILSQLGGAIKEKLSKISLESTW
jgi:hypothetical protein